MLHRIPIALAFANVVGNILVVGDTSSVDGCHSKENPENYLIVVDCNIRL